MKKWMEVKNIGQLNYERILVRFDIPLLFTCTDTDENRYIVVCADEETGIYVVGKTDIKSLLGMLKNKVTMYDYFRQCGQLYLITYDFDIDDFVWQSTSQEAITDDMLPDKGVFLELNNDNICEYIEELESKELYNNWDSANHTQWTELFISNNNKKYFDQVLNSIVNMIAENNKGIESIRSTSTLVERTTCDSIIGDSSYELVAA